MAESVTKEKLVEIINSGDRKKYLALLQGETIEIEKTEEIERSEEKKKTEAKKKLEVPIHLKFTLTLEEAAAYFGIGINRLRDITNEKNCDFVLFVGTKRLIKRTKLETYLEDISTL